MSTPGRQPSSVEQLRVRIEALEKHRRDAAIAEGFLRTDIVARLNSLEFKVVVLNEFMAFASERCGTDFRRKRWWQFWK